MKITKERLAQIKEHAVKMKAQAEHILTGEGDNYDGADGARYIRVLCCQMGELIEALEAKP